MANRQEYLDYLCHHGTRGQRWGKRNYQYEDGTGTPEGLKRRREEYRRENPDDDFKAPAIRRRGDVGPAKRFASRGERVSGTVEGEGIKRENRFKNDDKFGYKKKDVNFDPIDGDAVEVKSKKQQRAEAKAAKKAEKEAKKAERSKVDELNEQQAQADNARYHRNKTQYALDDQNKAAEKRMEKYENKRDVDWAGAKQVVDASKGLTSNMSTAVDVFGPKAKRKYSLDLSQVSDDELRAQINRARLEQSYNDIFNPVVENKGKQRVKEILAGTGAVLGVAGSALAIAVAIKQLRSK